MSESPTLLGVAGVAVLLLGDMLPLVATTCLLLVVDGFEGCGNVKVFEFSFEIFRKSKKGTETKLQVYKNRKIWRHFLWPDSSLFTYFGRKIRVRL